MIYVNDVNDENVNDENRFYYDTQVPTFSHEHEPLFPSLDHFIGLHLQRFMCATSIWGFENLSPDSFTCIVYHTQRVLVW